jgi:hypothetical protein
MAGPCEASEGGLRTSRDLRRHAAHLRRRPVRYPPLPFAQPVARRRLRRCTTRIVESLVAIRQHPLTLTRPRMQMGRALRD